MGTVQCPSCGEHVEISTLDDPPTYVEHEADEHGPRRFVIVGGHSGWLLHRCDMPAPTMTRHDD